MSYSFDGVNDLVSAPAAILGNLLTITAWFKATTLGEGSAAYLVAQGPGAGPRVLLGFINSPASAFYIRSGRATATGQWKSDTAMVQLGNWQHIAMTYDATVTTTDPQLYLNGQPIPTTRTAAPSGAVFADNLAFYLGGQSTTANTFDGLIGEVGVWTRLLAASEVQVAYLRGPLAQLRTLLFWYRGSKGALAFDLSGGGHTGTLAGPVFNADNPPRMRVP